MTQHHGHRGFLFLLLLVADSAAANPWDKGSLYSGFVHEAPLPASASESAAAVRHVETNGEAALFAVVFEGDAVEIAYETISGKVGWIRGRNERSGWIDGEIKTAAAQGSEAISLQKAVLNFVPGGAKGGTVTGFRAAWIHWFGSGGKASVVLRRPKENDFVNEGSKIAPESAKWVYMNPSGAEFPQFYTEKITARHGPCEKVLATVGSVTRDAGRIRISFQSAGAKSNAHTLEIPDRPNNRVPVRKGSRVTLHVARDGRIPLVGHECVPEFFRLRRDGVQEYGLISVPFEAVRKAAPPFALLAKQPRLAVLPDFCPYAESSLIALDWWPYDDKIAWNQEAAGPGELEIEAAGAAAPSLQRLPDDTIVPGRDGWMRATFDNNPLKRDEWVDDLNAEGPDARRRYQKKYPMQVRIWSAG